MNINIENPDKIPTRFTVVHDLDASRPDGAVAITDDIGLRVWTPILGPSAVLMARVLYSEPGRQWHIADLAGHLGVAVQVAQRTLTRLTMFGWMIGSLDCFDVVTYRIRQAKSVPARQLERLHPDIADMYARHLAGQQTA